MKGKTRKSNDISQSTSAAANDDKSNTNNAEATGNEANVAASMLELSNSSTLTFPSSDVAGNSASSASDIAKPNPKIETDNYCQKIITYFEEATLKTKEKSWKIQTFANHVAKCPEDVFVALLDILSSFGVAQFVNDGTEFQWLGTVKNDLVDGALSAASKRVNFNPSNNIKANKIAIAPRRLAQDILYLVKVKGSSMNLDGFKAHIESTSNLRFLSENFPKSWTEPLNSVAQILESLKLIHSISSNEAHTGLNTYKYGPKQNIEESSSEDIFAEPVTSHNKNSSSASASGSGSKNFKVTIREKQKFSPSGPSPFQKANQSLSDNSSSKAKVTMSFSEVGVSHQSSQSKRIKRANLDDSYLGGPNPLPRPEYGEHPASSFLTNIIATSTEVDDENILFDSSRMNSFLNASVTVVDMSSNSISTLPTPDNMYAYQTRCLAEFMLRYNAFYSHFSKTHGIKNAGSNKYYQQQVQASINQANNAHDNNDKDDSGSSNGQDSDANKVDPSSPLPYFALGVSATLQSLTDDQRMQSSQFSITDMDIMTNESNDDYSGRQNE